MRYVKPALTFGDQVALLQARGLTVDEPAYAEIVLSHISYYRLSAYFRQFRAAGSERFTETSFDDIVALYRFDKNLRLLISDALETIEVHFRTRITYHLALRGGAFAYVDPIYFVPSFNHQEFLEQVKNLEKGSSDKFVRHFRVKYAEERHLAIWMATELMSFGFLSRVYKALTTDLQKEIASDIGVHQSILRSWLHTLSYIRNICAHHARLWNRELAVAPQIPSRSDRWPYLGVEPKRCYAVVVLICDLLERIGAPREMQVAFFKLLQSANTMQRAGMRVPANWETFHPWSDLQIERDGGKEI